jgi:hypothetical protein
LSRFVCIFCLLSECCNVHAKGNKGAFRGHTHRNHFPTTYVTHGQ